jgi:hypothetical protein
VVLTKRYPHGPWQCSTFLGRGLSAGRSCLARGGGVQAEACAHALLPRALFSFAFFNLRQTLAEIRLRVGAS